MRRHLYGLRVRALVVLTFIWAAPGVLQAQGVLENPQPESFQSGIGLISGWACEASQLDIVIDDTTTVQAAYGTERGDTSSACGDTDNGFGLLINWNLFGDGTHTVRALVDGVEFGSATFTIRTLGHEFLRGLSGQDKVVNFGNQINVTVRWQESTQSFVIVDTTAPIRTGPVVGFDPDGSGTLPFCETPDEGRAATAADIDAFSRKAGFLSTTIRLCAVSVDNLDYFTSGIANNTLSTATDPGYVYYDVTLLNRFEAVNESADDFILAHEWGHQIQFDNPSRAALPDTRLFELQADCLAGIYFGHLSFINPEFMIEEDVSAIVLAVCSLGILENLDWTSIADHGTCEERASAFALGFLAAFSTYQTGSSFDPFSSFVCG
jgi:hypothetical protein